MAEGPTHGTFCWNELMTRDPEKAGKFFKELIGWEPTDSGMPGMPYTLFKMGENQVGGMMMMPPEIPAQVPPHWMAYIQVDDVDALVGKLGDLGGKLLHGPQDIPTVGRFVVIEDPTGAVVSLITLAGSE
jgi:predicted enzyme related to lactoylglutathione lyase